MKKRDFQARVRATSAPQWFLVGGPLFAGVLAAWFSRHDLEFPQPLYFLGGGVATSLLIGFLMLYGDEL